MARTNLGKRIALDTRSCGRESWQMRTRFRAGVLATALAALGSSVSAAQAALTTDLWRVAAGTLVVPAAIASDGSAALWTPAAALAGGPGPSLRLGVETIHAPADAGVSGAVASAAVRLLGKITLNAVYGRLWLADLVRTETSPETIGSVPVYAEVVSLGVARRPAGSALAVGVAVRALTGRLDYRSETKLVGDVGAEYLGSHLRLGVATHFFDPTSAARELGATYTGAAEYRSSQQGVWGAPAVVCARYGVTWAHGEGATHLVSAGLALAGAFEFDVGAANERTAGTSVWRSRTGAAVLQGRYRVYVGRDGGVNGFGATYRFGLSATAR